MSFRRRVSIGCVAVVLAVSFLAGPTWAQASGIEKLTKVLPDDVVALVAFAGTDALKTDFEKSIVGRLWLDPSTQSFVEQIKGQLMALAGKEAEDPNVPAQITMALDYAKLVTSRPFAAGVARVEAEEGPPLCAFAILDAGPHKPRFAEALTRLETMFGEGKVVDKHVGPYSMRTAAGEDFMPPYWGWVGDYLVAAVNDGEGTVTKMAGGPGTVVPAALKPVPGGKDALLVHVDVETCLRMGRKFVREAGGEKEMGLFSAVVGQLGFSGIKSLTDRAGFVGPDVFEHALIEMPSPPTGLLATFKPVDPNWFAAVDARAVQAGALNWDVAATYDLAMKVVRDISPDEGYPEIQKAIADFESDSKVRIRDGLLESLAGPALGYVLPAGSMIEAPAGGFIGIARLDDAKLFEETMTTLGRFVSGHSNGVLQVSSREQADGRTVHVWAVAPLALAQMMPTWTVVDDHVVVASNAALCNLGVAQLETKEAHKRSLLDTQGYRRVAKTLPEHPISLTYTDTRVQFQQFRMQLQQFWPMATMFATRAGVKLPLMLPALEDIAQDMGPSVQYSYFGAEGLHTHYRGPGFEVSVGSVVGVAMGAGILMPALDRVRQRAYRMTSATNLSGIGKACVIYANDHDDKLPPSLRVLVDEGLISSESLESKRRPKDFDGPSYIYIPGQTLSMYPGNIVAYENPEFCLEGANVLHLDSHVEFMKPEMFRQELKQTYERLGRPMPPVRFKDEAEREPGTPQQIAERPLVRATG